MTSRIASVLTLLLLGGIVAWSATGTTQSYTLTAFPMTDPGTVQGYAVNDSGQIAGALYDADTEDSRAYVWSPSGQATDLGLPSSEAYDINADGTVVGYYWAGTARHAFRWKDGTTTDLGSLPGYAESVATGVNASGQVVGYCYDATAGSRAFFWDGGTMTDLGSLAGSGSSASAINDSGTVVGWSVVEDGTTHACAWDAAGGMRDLGVADGHEVSVAVAIDAAGRAVGWSYSLVWRQVYPGYWEGAGPRIATLFDDGAAIALGGPDTYAYGIRDASADHGVQIVGKDQSDYFSPVALLWEIDSAGHVTEHALEDLLDAAFAGVLGEARATCPSGRIVAGGYDNAPAVFLLTPSTLPPVQPPLSAPSLVAASAGSERVTLSWSAVPGAGSYVLQRGTTPGGPYQTIATGVTETTFVDMSAPLGSTSYYVVAAADATRVSPPSAEVAAAPLPYPPTNLTAKAGKGKVKNEANLKWTTSASRNITNYRVYRRTSAGNELIATLGPATSYTVTGLSRGTHSFCVTAVHAGSQESFFSNVAGITVR